MTPMTIDIRQSLAITTAVLVDGVDQRVIAGILNVEPSRVSETVTALKWACENIKTVYGLATMASKPGTVIKAQGEYTVTGIPDKYQQAPVPMPDMPNNRTKTF